MPDAPGDRDETNPLDELFGRSGEGADPGPAPSSRRAAREAAARRAAGQDAAATDGSSGRPVGSPARAAAPASDAEFPFVIDGRPRPDSGTAPASVPAAAPSPPVAGRPEPSLPESTAPRSGGRSAPAAAPGTLEDLFATASSPPPRPRRRRRTGCLVALIIVLVLLGGAAAGGIWVANTYGEKIGEALGWGEPKDYEPGLAHGEALVVVQEGDVGIDVSRALWNAGVTKTEEVFYDHLVKEAADVTFYPGLYRLQLEMTAADALAALQDPANRMEGSVLLREGLTVAQSLTLLAEGTGIPLEDLTAAADDPAAFGVEADSLEGWLFPATYEFQPGMTAAEVLQVLVDRAVQSLDEAGVPVGERQRILTIASIIQREARFEDDFFMVSRVIQNRLDQGMRLEMDSTAQYGFGELHAGVASTSAEAQYDDNPWNTYVHEGLPAGPISNPGDLAIDAAMHPVDGPWLYFVTVNLETGETQFSVTYEEHLQGVDRWLQWCDEHPGDSGC